MSTTPAVEDVSSAVNVLRTGRRTLTADERRALFDEREELRRLVRLAMIGALMVDPDAHEWRVAAMAVMK